MNTPRAGGDPEALYARLAAATAGSAYRLRRTERGFDLVVDVPQSTRRVQVLHTYRVELLAREGTFTLTDVVRTRQRGSLAGQGLKVEIGRSRYRTWGTSPGGTRFSFSSSDGHRLIRGAAEELGWRERRPATARAAVIAGVAGGLIALSTLIELAITFWL